MASMTTPKGSHTLVRPCSRSCPTSTGSPDVIHCNDWQTALIPVYYNLMFAGPADYAGIKTVFTIHNIAFQGRYGRVVLEYVMGIDDAHFRSGFMEMDGDVNLMKAAILAAGAVTTVVHELCRGDPDALLRPRPGLHPAQQQL